MTFLLFLFLRFSEFLNSDIYSIFEFPQITPFEMNSRDTNVEIQSEKTFQPKVFIYNCPCGESIVIQLFWDSYASKPVVRQWYKKANGVLHEFKQDEAASINLEQIHTSSDICTVFAPSFNFSR